MDPWQKLLEGEASEWRFLLGEERCMETQFVKIGKRVVNPAQVQAIYYEPHGGLGYDSPCVVIDFGGQQNSISVFEKYEPEVFTQLMIWMDEQRPLLTD